MPENRIISSVCWGFIMVVWMHTFVFNDCQNKSLTMINYHWRVEGKDFFRYTNTEGLLTIDTWWKRNIRECTLARGMNPEGRVDLKKHHWTWKKRLQLNFSKCVTFNFALGNTFLFNVKYNVDRQILASANFSSRHWSYNCHEMDQKRLVFLT